MAARRNGDATDAQGTVDRAIRGHRISGLYSGRGHDCAIWRSFDHLEAYAKSREHAHLPAWSKFNKAVKNSRGDVGIWHETYLVRAGDYETLYSGMPEFGLGKASTLVLAEGSKDAARSRITKDTA